MPVDREQHGAEHNAVIPVELVTDRRDQVLADPGRILLTPGRDRGSGPVRRVVVPGTSRLTGLPHHRVPTGRIQFTGSGLSCDGDTWEHEYMPGNTGRAP